MSINYECCSKSHPPMNPCHSERSALILMLGLLAWANNPQAEATGVQKDEGSQKANKKHFKQNFNKKLRSRMQGHIF